MKNKMLDSLKAVLRSLEAHLDDESRRLGVPRSQLCPCDEQEVAQAKAIIAEAEREPPISFIFQVGFDDHDSFYEVSVDVLKKIITLPLNDPDIIETIISKGKPVSVQSDAEAQWWIGDEMYQSDWDDICKEAVAEIEYEERNTNP